jgi:membrane protease YdiL (CAAX protease family)
MFFSVLAMGMIGAIFISSIFILFRFGFSPETLMQVQQNLIDYPDLIRGVQFFQVIGVFIFPAIICGRLFSDNYKSYLKIDVPVAPSTIILTIVSILVAVPFLNLTYVINQQMVFPEWLKGLEEWMITMEESNALALEKMLYADTIWIFFINIVITCILAGIGEEFIFRGVLQNIFGKVLKNPHIIIWSAAIIFSTIHLQFYGFIPRLLLGAYFGYLLLYTGTIWIPVIGHFTHNLFHLIINYIYQDSPKMFDETAAIGSGQTGWLSVVSFALFVFLFWQIKKRAALSKGFSS